MPFKDSETAKEYFKQYRRDNEMHISIALRYDSDMELIEHVKNKTNKTEYIKRLIREDMNRS